MVRIGTPECQVVRILDADGTPLTTATTRATEEEDALALADVDDPGALMDYYFGRGERLVVVDLNGSTLEGMLDTRWQSIDRIWWVGLSRTFAAFAINRSSPHEAARETVVR